MKTLRALIGAQEFMLKQPGVALPRHSHYKQCLGTSSTSEAFQDEASFIFPTREDLGLTLNRTAYSYSEGQQFNQRRSIGWTVISPLGATPSKYGFLPVTQKPR